MSDDEKPFDLRSSTVGIWILARLYDESERVSRKDLARNLCSQSFDTMKDDDEFENVLEHLNDNNWIEHSRINATISSSQPRKTGYHITIKGIMAFRRNISAPYFTAFMKKDEIEFPPNLQGPLQTLFEDIDNLGHSLAAAAINNAPLIMQITLELVKLLQSYK